jgi:hypothetical protein
MVKDPDATPVGKMLTGKPLVRTCPRVQSVPVPRDRRRRIVPVARSTMRNSIEPLL